jgi:hypothetical protein
MFIPKPRKDDCTEAKAYRPVSLSSFLLKMMEELVDRHVRDSAMGKFQLHRNQHVCSTGKFTEIILHNVITCTENATEQKNIALGEFLTMERAHLIQ